jgi:hypothetical protein
LRGCRLVFTIVSRIGWPFQEKKPAEKISGV